MNELNGSNKKLEEQMLLELRSRIRSKNRDLKRKNNATGKINDFATGVKKSELAKYIDFNKGKSFEDIIQDYLNKNNLKASELYKRACVDRRTYSKMAIENYRISKNTAICFCLAMHLDLDETQKALRTLGYSLSNYDDFDIIISYFIEKQIYDIQDINYCLYDFGLPFLGAKTRD